MHGAMAGMFMSVCQASSIGRSTSKRLLICIIVPLRCRASRRQGHSALRLRSQRASPAVTARFACGHSALRLRSQRASPAVTARFACGHSALRLRSQRASPAVTARFACGHSALRLRSQRASPAVTARSCRHRRNRRPPSHSLHCRRITTGRVLPLHAAGRSDAPVCNHHKHGHRRQ